MQRKIAGFRAAMSRLLGLDDRGHRLVRRAVASRRRGRRRGRRPAARPRRHRHRLRLRPDGPRRDPRGPGARDERAGRRVGGRLRRLAADRVHRSAADHDAPAGAGDVGGRGAGARRRDQRPCRAAFGVHVPPGAGGPGLHRGGPLDGGHRGGSESHRAGVAGRPSSGSDAGGQPGGDAGEAGPDLFRRRRRTGLDDLVLLFLVIVVVPLASS